MFRNGTVIKERDTYFVQTVFIDGFIFRVKVIKKSASWNFQKARTLFTTIHNLHLISLLDHPNILKLYAITEDDDYIYIVHENPLHDMRDQTLSESYIARNIALPLLDVIHTLVENNFGIYFLHAASIYHTGNNVWKLGICDEFLFYDKTLQSPGDDNPVAADLGATLFAAMAPRPMTAEARSFIASCNHSDMFTLMNHVWIKNTESRPQDIRRSMSLIDIPVTVVDETVMGSSPPVARAKTVGFEKISKFFRKTKSREL
jgi:hypothetical protein